MAAPSGLVPRQEAPIGTSQPSRRTGAAVASAAALLGGVAFYAVFVLRSAFRVQGQLTFTLFDDAMISLTYARNLAAGDGLLWMPGQPPVEGYTNFLWTLGMALPHLAGLPDRLAALPVMIFGAALLVATSLLAMRLAGRLSSQRWAPPLALAATAFSYPLVFWTLRGLEVGLLACLVSAACLLALRRLERRSARDLGLLCAALVAAVLTRPDAVVPVAVVLGFLAVSSRRTRRDAFAGAVATAAALAAHTAFRLWYYGSLVPNTYALKVEGHSLLERVARGAVVLGELLSSTLWAPAALVLALVLVRRRALGQGERLLLALVVSSLAYSVWAGGDVWEFADFSNRFIAVALPALMVLALRGIEATLDARGRDAKLALAAIALGLAAFAAAKAGAGPGRIGAAEPLAAALSLGLLLVAAARGARPALGADAVAVCASLLLIVFANFRPVLAWATGGGLHVRDDEISVRTGLSIRDASPPEARVAVIWAGAIPYFSHRPAIDLFGKSDPVIAHLAPRGPFLPGHDKWDFDYSIGELRPDLIVLTWHLGPSDQRKFQQWGYERVAQYWVRRGAEVDRAKLLAPWR